jgi:undecaprenyl-diphosphatase
MLVIWALLVCYSRIYNGVHYPSDVFAGMLIGALLGGIGYFSYRFLFQTLKN